MKAEEALARAVETDFYRGRTSTAHGWSATAPTRRADLVRDQVDHLPFGTRRPPNAGTPVRVGTSGSGESLLLLPWSEHDLALERRAGARMLARLGIAPATPIANTLAGALVTPGSLLFGDVVEEHGALDIPLGAIESDAAAKQAWELVDRVSPAILVLEAATAARFFTAAPAAKREWLRGIVWLQRGGVTARAEVPPGVGFAGWQRSWLAVPEAACFVASTCAEGAYHADESLLVEVLDGNLVLTPLAGENALLRYDTGLRAGVVEKCGCGGVAAFVL